ncbi:N1R/p28-like protein [Mythimna separata entomopoxvirus 'L']|uniref:N1R/p28-like protein n=1 Tax=Mythimna separata entomopoxvirus 'L' TaxID=1293572 RepID=A0A916P1U0_9POXV|nr:N1R/p28-like protein [Mythimna separata entomopoxvirus 'L']YP_008003821.1 N1R/p28-like protein [Mythimna separata entomopoxvirus 'L']CCU56201.1 N1R/p28-like protein [Mythimna separata entomopoxvirus 'L']CCU56502.1 N1R/p28-like protein [Mythimna separata entomopoxvirus 'L']
MSLNDICYEKIKDSFYYGLFGDFKLIIDKNTGYFNATKLCKDGGKEYKHWYENTKSREFILFIDAFLRSRNTDRANKDILYVKKGNNKTEEDKIITGTYVHKLLLLNISLWISNEFYIKCYDIIEKYYIDEFTTEYKDDKDKLYNKIKEIESVITEKNNAIDSLENSVKYLNISNSALNETMASLRPKIITPPSDDDKYSTFTVIKLYNENKEDEYNYYITTVCERDYRARIDNLRSIYPELIIILKLNRVPNSKYLLDVVKKQTCNIIDFNNHKFDLLSININKFINIIMEIKEYIE